MFPENPNYLDPTLEAILEPSLALLNHPKEKWEQVINVFRGWIESGLDLSNEKNSWILCHQYILAAKKFLDVHAIHSAIELLLHGWKEFSLWQYTNNMRVYRAAIAMNLAAIHYYYLNDKNAAIWWAFHTQADDHLTDWEKGGGGRQMLETVLGVTDEALNAFWIIARDNLNEIRNVSTANWQQSSLFAEDIVRRFAVEKPQYSYLFGQVSTLTEFPISPKYFETLLESVKKANSADDKGKSLERLASYLFLLIPGCVPRQNVYDTDQTFETDLVVRNLNPSSNLMSEVFGRYFVAECKNWSYPVGSRDVGYFLYKMRLMHASFGILFSKNGITGESSNEVEKAHDVKAAKSLIRRAFHEDGIICLVISLSELERIANGNTTFRSLLFELSEEFRFGAY